MCNICILLKQDDIKKKENAYEDGRDLPYVQLQRVFAFWKFDITRVNISGRVNTLINTKNIYSKQGNIRYVSWAKKGSKSNIDKS